MSIDFSVRAGSQNINWLSCPINPDWVLEGKPVARIEVLSSSADGTATTAYWECTKGRFNWFYNFDETLHIIEGGVALKNPAGEIKRIGPGDVIFFPAGSQAEWTVDSYVKKLAFCRTPLPAPLVSVRSVVRAMKRMVRGGGEPQGIFPTG